MKKKYILIPFICFFYFAAFSQTDSAIDNMRSDTIDVLHYDIQLDFTGMSAQTLTAVTTITFKSKMNNVHGISLDLLGFTIDAVKTVQTDLNYVYNDTLLRVMFNLPMNSGEENEITVKYHGTPQTDQSGFGGFYFQNDYAYNMGVGFLAKPHVYGRVWHPCFDNFVERASYTIEVKSPQGKTSYSNGYIVSDSIGQNNENIRKWQIDEKIPSYLACVGVAPYVEVNQIYNSVIDGSQIPIVLAAKAHDTTKLKSSFVHLKDAAAIYENLFGAYRWNKIGYTIVPFNAGAMEHATNIMYPLLAANGSLQYETMMAHELAHHWWGNLVTCRTAEDMWINEGFATYCGSLFLENLYSYDNYLNDIKNTHYEVIQKAHFKDGGFFPLSGVPHEATYGSHTYEKGSTMLHNLRTYLGDEKFFLGLKAIIDNYQHKDIDALEIRDALTNATGFNLDKFFKNYIFSPGFNGFEIDSFTVAKQGSQFETHIFIRQKLFEAPDFFEDVPLQVTFLDENLNEFKTDEIVTGEYSDFVINLPFEPKMAFLNGSDKLLNAVTGANLTVNAPTTRQVNYAYIYLNVVNEQDSSFLRVEHCRIPPDPIKDGNLKSQYVISPERYWKIDGFLSDSFQAKARLFYDARNNAVGNLDNKLLKDVNGNYYHEDSIVLMWRPNKSADWQIYNDYDLFTSTNKNDGYGRVELSNVVKGEYTFALKKNTLNLKEKESNNMIKVYPNPANENFKVEWKGGNKKVVKIYDVNGKIVENLKMSGDEIQISTKKLSKGIYNVLLFENNQLVKTHKVVKQ